MGGADIEVQATSKGLEIGYFDEQNGKAILVARVVVSLKFVDGDVQGYQLEVYRRKPKPNKTTD